MKRYHAAVLAEKEIQEEIDQLRMDKMFPALIQDGMPHGSSCMDLSEYAAQLDELLTELKDKMEQRIRIRREITQRIEAMRDETEKNGLEAAVHSLDEVGADRRENGVQFGTCSKNT